MTDTMLKALQAHLLKTKPLTPEEMIDKFTRAFDAVERRVEELERSFEVRVCYTSKTAEIALKNEKRIKELAVSLDKSCARESRLQHELEEMSKRLDSIEQWRAGANSLTTGNEHKLD